MLSMSNTAVASGYGPIFGGSPGDDEKVADPACCSSQQIRQHTEKVPVSTCVMDDGFHPDFVLDHQG
jgi:hypothetical protein